MKHLKKFDKINGDYEKLTSDQFTMYLSDVDPGDYRDMDLDRLSVVFPTANIQRKFDSDDLHYYLIFRLGDFKAYIYEIKNEYYYLSIYDYRGYLSVVSDSFFKCDQDTGLIKCLIDNISNLL